MLRLAAEAALALDDLDAADSYATRSHALAVELGMAAETAIARRTSGQIARVRGAFVAAEAHLEVSRAALAELDNRYELGRTRYQQALLAHARGDAATFATARAEAESIFAELDAQRDLALARELG